MTAGRLARCALAIVCALPGAGLAAYPEKSLRFIVPVAPTRQAGRRAAARLRFRGSWSRGTT